MSVAGRTLSSRFRIEKRIAEEPMRPEDLETAERILAKLVALAFAAGRPEVSGQTPVDPDSSEERDMPQES